MGTHHRHDGIVLGGYRGRHFCRLHRPLGPLAVFRLPAIPVEAPLSLLQTSDLTRQIVGLSAILIIMVWAWLLQGGSVSNEVVVGGISVTAILGALATWFTKVIIPAIESARKDKIAATQALADAQHTRDVKIAELEAKVEESRNAAILDVKNATIEMTQAVKDLGKHFEITWGAHDDRVIQRIDTLIEQQGQMRRDVDQNTRAIVAHLDLSKEDQHPRGT